MKKLSEVVLLPTSKNKYNQNMIGLDNTRLVYGPTAFTLITQLFHSYICTKEELKIGDIVLCDDIYICTVYDLEDRYAYVKHPDGQHSKRLKIDLPKIIATGDQTLFVEIDCPDNIKGCEVYHTKRLPLIPKTFIKEYIAEYNKGNVIKEVFVEFINDERIIITIPKTIEKMEQILDLRKVDAYTVYSSDSDRSGSEKGIYRNSSIATVKAQKSGWYGQDGEVRLKSNTYINKEGVVFQVTMLGRFTDEQEEYKQDLINSIKSKLSPEELALLGIK